MYCGNCGKKVMDNMQFCPFCGKQLLVQSQDPVEQEEGNGNNTEPQKPTRVVSLFEGIPEKPREVKREFEPLKFDFEEIKKQVEAEDSIQTNVPEISSDDTETAIEDIEDVSDGFTVFPPEIKPEKYSCVHETKGDSRVRQPEVGRNAKTLIPVKEVNPDDLFLDNEEQSMPEKDAYDIDDDYDRDDDDDFIEYEEREKGGFFQRHIRGMVALILMLVLLAVMGIWTITDSAQKTLAKFNLAWSADAYAEVAKEYYNSQSYSLAGQYFEKAFDRDKDNYTYAYNAAASYTAEGNYDKATEVLLDYINAHPYDTEAYIDLMSLYQDASTRPFNINEVLRQGYKLTGDERLNV